MSVDDRPTLMRRLGRLVGHVGRAIASSGDGSGTVRTEVGRQSEEREATTPDGRRVVLRRTTIDEVEIREPGGREPGDRSPDKRGSG